MIDLSGIDTPTLQAWYNKAIASMAATATGGRVTNVSYSQADGSKSVSYAPTTQTEILAWMARISSELRCRGVQSGRRRRAIGVRF